MQKISLYLYNNRIPLLLNIDPSNVEYTTVYQRILKLYPGINNIIEFDIKNSDQKRVNLSPFTNVQMTVMDINGIELPNSPYAAIPSNKKGIATVSIPQDDLIDLSDQFLSYSVTATKDGTEFLLYTDTMFNATSTIQVIGNATPKIRNDVTYDSFTPEIDIHGIPTYHTSAIPTKFYESTPIQSLSFEISVVGFVGSIWIDATKQNTITNEAFKHAGKPFGAWTQSYIDGTYSGIIPFGQNIPISDYSYFRISYQTPNSNGVGATFNVFQQNDQYLVTLNTGGTGYSIGSQILVPGDHLGGTNGTNDLLITVTALDTRAVPNSYVVSSILSFSYSGVAVPNSKSFLASGSNYSGTVSNVIVQY